MAREKHYQGWGCGAHLVVRGAGGSRVG
ncbi:hypothetical protein FHU30_000344 [Actinomadura rupiterrae]|nr:hypothetical protein [Actinomadura rupiterrae]